MTAIRHLPGQVTILCSSSLSEMFDESYLSAFGEPMASEVHELRSGSYYLELFGANRGEELRFLEFMGSQSGVIAASLNYMGFGLTDRYIEEPPFEFQHDPGLGVERDAQYFLSLDGTVRSHPHEDFLNLLGDSRPKWVTAAIDVAPEHCQQVMSLISEGFERGNRDSGNEEGPLAIIGLTSNLDNSTITDLHGYCGRLLRLAGLAESVGVQVVSINMSVDFAQIIRGYNDLDPANMESPDSVFSIPLLQKTLSLVLANLATPDSFGGTPLSPAVFAAAGNRLEAGDPPRVRLGYPAIRPETIAATFVTNLNSGDSNPVEWVDIPATTGLKPCFAIDVGAMHPSRSDGSSFASAWLAGYYSALCISGEPVGRLGPLSKVAWLMQRTRRSRLPGGRQRLPCFVEVVGGGVVQSRGDRWDLDELIDDLQTEFEADFCLHGSTSAVGEWLRLNKRHWGDLKAWVHKDLGDVDLLYGGDIRRESDEEADPEAAADDAKRFVRGWFQERLGRSWVRDRKRPVELHQYEGVVKASERLRSVTPVSKLYITQGGLIDTWGGLDDLKQRKIRFFPLTHPAFWARNAYFRTGADSLGLNILEWISVTTLLRLVSRALDVKPPIADENSVAAVDRILSHHEEGKTVRLFGHGRGDRRERLDRRFERVETLMGSCARCGIIDSTLDSILARLHQLRGAPNRL